MASIQLKFQAAAEVNGKEQDGLLLLSDQEQQRQLVITCSRKILKEITERKSNEAQEEMKLRQRSMQYAGNFMNELYVKAKVVDNRYLFF